MPLPYSLRPTQAQYYVFPLVAPDMRLSSLLLGHFSPPPDQILLNLDFSPLSYSLFHVAGLTRRAMFRLPMSLTSLALGRVPGTP